MVAEMFTVFSNSLTLSQDKNPSYEKLKFSWSLSMQSSFCITKTVFHPKSSGLSINVMFGTKAPKVQMPFQPRRTLYKLYFYISNTTLFHLGLANDDLLVQY